MELKQIMSSASVKHLRTRLSCKCRDCEWEMQQDLEGSESRAARDGDLSIEVDKHAAGGHVVDLHTEYFYELSKAEPVPDLPIQPFSLTPRVAYIASDHYPLHGGKLTARHALSRLPIYLLFGVAFHTAALWFASSDAGLGALAAVALFIATLLWVLFGFALCAFLFLREAIHVAWREKRDVE